jgi:hypothetical protein
MLPRLTLALLVAVAVPGCLSYEYEHEIWLRVDGSGTVNLTGRPALFVAFKGIGRAEDPEGTVTRQAVRQAFEQSGLTVRRVTLTRRRGHQYLFISADFKDLAQLASTPAFRDLKLALRKEGDQLRLDGRWARPRGGTGVAPGDREGLMAVRFHLPSKIYEHRNAAEGVERGNILGWRQDVAAALDGGTLDIGALMDNRSILMSTVVLFVGSILLAVALLTLAFLVIARKGRQTLEQERSP